MRILCVGCTGFVGTAVRHVLCDAGHQLLVVSRYKNPSSHRYESWISYGSDWMDHLGKMDAVINLAGEPIAQILLTRGIRNSLRDSRVGINARIIQRLGRFDKLPGVWINASAVGIYGDRGEEILTEESAPGSGFLADLCKEWEVDVERSAQLGMREVRLRFGPVLGRGGILAGLKHLARFHLGGRIGSGDQYLPWIALSDLVRSVLFVLENPMVQGASNVVSPGIVRQRQFAESMANVLNIPTQIPMPGLVANHLPGTLRELLVHSQRAIPDKLQKSGFNFVQTNLEECLQELL